MEREEWLQWRHQGIGSSDAPAVMGASPWKTRYQLWEEKTAGKAVESPANFAMQRGNELEPIARAKFAAAYELQLDFTAEPESFDPRLFHMEDLPFMRASLDGCSKDGKTIIEIKFVGAEEFASEVVPEKYFWQIQHQFLVSGAETGFYVKINADKEIRFIPVSPEPEKMDELLGECTVFWEHVISKKPPALEKGDYKELRVKGAVSRVARFKALKRQIGELETELETVREELIAMLSHPRMTCRGVKFMEITRQGNIQYAKIEALKGIDLEQYRGKPSTSWRIEC